jgi:hypothetical protein
MFNTTEKGCPSIIIILLMTIVINLFRFKETWHEKSIFIR